MISTEAAASASDAGGAGSVVTGSVVVGAAATVVDGSLGGVTGAGVVDGSISVIVCADPEPSVDEPAELSLSEPPHPASAIPATNQHEIRLVIIAPSVASKVRPGAFNHSLTGD